MINNLTNTQNKFGNILPTSYLYTMKQHNHNTDMFPGYKAPQTPRYMPKAQQRSLKLIFLLMWLAIPAAGIIYYILK